MSARPRICPDLRFEEAQHRYFLGERELPSVTTILAAEGLADTRFFTEEHRKAGVRRHTYAELVDLARMDDLVESNLDPAGMFVLREMRGEAPPELGDPEWEQEIRAAVRAWRSFLDDTGFEPHYIEEPIYSVLGYAGRIDRVGLLGRDLTIIDVKGASEVSSYGPQVQLYGYAWKERTGEQPTKLLCVHLRKDGTYQAKAHDDRRSLGVGMAAVQLHNWKRANARAGGE